MIRALTRCANTIAAAVRSPADAVLFVCICAFIVRLRGDVRRLDVPAFFRMLRDAPRPRARSFERDYQRIVRLRDAALAMPRLWRRDTCYVRALTLYRFLDAGERRIQVHFGVEQPASSAERLRGHAWISVDGRLFEAPDAVRFRRVHEVPLHVAI